jgi:hypothetical protein
MQVRYQLRNGPLLPPTVSLHLWPMPDLRAALFPLRPGRGTMDLVHDDEPGRIHGRLCLGRLQH